MEDGKEEEEEGDGWGMGRQKHAESWGCHCAATSAAPSSGSSGEDPRARARTLVRWLAARLGWMGNGLAEQGTCAWAGLGCWAGCSLALVPVLVPLLALGAGKAWC